MAEKTLFQQILDHDIPAEFVHEDEHCGAFRDVNPAAPVHLLVVPRKPIPSADDIAEEDRLVIGHLFFVARQVAAQEGLDQGYRLVINCGEHGQQTVPHLHLHVLGGRPMNWPPG